MALVVDQLQASISMLKPPGIIIFQGTGDQAGWLLGLV